MRSPILTCILPAQCDPPAGDCGSAGGLAAPSSTSSPSGSCGHAEAAGGLLTPVSPSPSLVPYGQGFCSHHIPQPTLAPIPSMLELRPCPILFLPALLPHGLFQPFLGLLAPALRHIQQGSREPVLLAPLFSMSWRSAGVLTLSFLRGTATSPGTPACSRRRCTTSGVCASSSVCPPTLLTPRNGLRRR